MAVTKKQSPNKSTGAKKVKSQVKVLRKKIDKNAKRLKVNLGKNAGIAKVKIAEEAEIAGKELEVKRKEIETKIKKKPLISVGLGILAGFTLGKLLRFHKKKTKE